MEIKKFLETNSKQEYNIPIPKGHRESSTVLRELCNNGCTCQKMRKIPNKQLYASQRLGKKEQTKPQICKRKEITKTRAKINGTERNSKHQWKKESVL